MLDWLFQGNFMPHGHCYFWRPDILWTHVISDALIAAAYFSIPITLIWFVRRRRDLPFPWILLLFAAFILLCGTTHIMDIITVWKPIYALDGAVKATTAVVSVITAIALVPLVPLALTLRSPRELEIANRRLSEEITRRERAEAEALRARDEALKISETKSQFLANMSHEIRTPMNGVIGMTTALLETPLDAQQRDFTETIRFSGESLLAVINDILDLSKIEAGAMRVEFEDFDLVDVVEKAAAIVALRAQSKDLELIAGVDSGVPTELKGDSHRLLQVLTNLLSNAVKFTPKGEVQLSVASERKHDHDYLLRFTIRDTGIGMSKEVLGRLFHPFVQADGSTTRRYGGTGLGLAISRRLVELMGGTMEVHSEPGRGSEFSFSLPFAKGARPSPTLPAKLSAVRALVVDDNETHRRTFASWLSGWGLRVDDAADAVTALDRLRNAVATGERYAFVIVDRGMPGMDGVELARRIAADSSLRGLRILLLDTAPTTNADAALEYRGIQAVLVKPVRQSALFNLLLNLIERSPVVRATPGAALAAEMAKPATEPLGDIKNYRVLVAEDNPINQRVALHQLQRLGLQVDVVNDGREAVDAVERANYDIVLMDCQMPELDGYGATEKIRQSAHCKRTQIVAMTAHAMSGDRERCLAAGMDDYVPKPVTPQALRAVLERCRRRLEEKDASIA